MADATNALDTLGEILPSDPGRDAIHLATYAVTSDERLFPGQHIGFTKDGKVSSLALWTEKFIGIVDPFLPAGVFPGQMFWMVLYPRSITSLRHAWTHPDIPAESKVTDAKSASEEWLRDFVARSDVPSYEEVVAAAIYAIKEGEHSVRFGDEASGEIPDEFWQHIEVVTGLKYSGEARPTYFSCAC